MILTIFILAGIFCVVQGSLMANYIVSTDIKEYLKPLIVIPCLFLTALFIMISIVFIGERFSKPKEPAAQYQQIEGSIYRKID